MRHREEARDVIFSYVIHQSTSLQHQTKAAYDDWQEALVQARTRKAYFERTKGSYYKAFGVMEYYGMALRDDVLSSGDFKKEVVVPGEDGDADIRNVFESGLSAPNGDALFTHIIPFRDSQSY